MPDPLSITFDFLAATENPSAVDALLLALDADAEVIRSAATTALLKRRSARGHIELIRRLHRLTPEMRAAVARNAAGIENALRQCLMHGDEELRSNALEMVRWLEDYSQVPALLNLIEDRGSPLRAQVLDVIQQLVDSLHNHLHADPDAAAQHYLRDASRIREQLVTAFEQSCHRYESHHCDSVVEGLLALGNIEDFVMKKLLRQLGHPCRAIAERLLLTSTHPGVMGKIVDFLSVNYPPQKVFQVIKQRKDPEFIGHLLRTWPRRLNPAQLHNLSQVNSLAWLQPDDLQLKLVPPALQKRIVPFIEHTGLPEENKRAVVEWLVKYGAPEARQAATEALEHESNDAVQEIVIEGLYADEPEVQAWATTQLRSRGIPQAFTLLIERLDSPMMQVQAAARSELGDFNLHRVLDLYDQLEPKTCMMASQLLQKIDPHALSKLKIEMANPMRSKRIRAAKAAVALNVHEQVVDALIRQLDDEDSMVRRTAVEILGKIPTFEVLQALQNMQDDPSLRVREEAERGVQQIQAQSSRLQAVAQHPLQAMWGANL